MDLIRWNWRRRFDKKTIYQISSSLGSKRWDDAKKAKESQDADSPNWFDKDSNDPTNSLERGSEVQTIEQDLGESNMVGYSV